MNYKKIKAKIKKLHDSEAKNIIYKQKGSYILYNIYKITNLNGLWEVQKNAEVVYKFESSSTALSWCLADYNNKIMLAYNLITADRRLQFKKNDVLARKEFLKEVTDPKTKEIVLSKMLDDIHTCKTIKLEIENECYSTKYIQIKGYIKQ